ncbi:hypothetical protein I7I53_11800 [Histoplasma capsulatum var. duboisii H88]|uniref:Secreted protein n=1 Tax=Ajellomyces capsulatus (strain H88) TaxID=544711 RepID=A0A8A1LYU6_AJEC8|nr:hypothetical protein I7I53_11800 [Histoplasma capsulatum var. duboisii H88]
MGKAGKGLDSNSKFFTFFLFFFFSFASPHQKSRKIIHPIKENIITIQVLYYFLKLSSNMPRITGLLRNNNSSS